MPSNTDAYKFSESSFTMREFTLSSFVLCKVEEMACTEMYSFLIELLKILYFT